MAIALLSTSFALSPPLHSMARRLLRLVHMQPPVDDAGTPRALPARLRGACSNDSAGPADDGRSAAGAQPAAGAPRPRPRSNWPFTVQPAAAPAPRAVSPPTAGNGSSLLLATRRPPARRKRASATAPLRPPLAAVATPLRPATPLRKAHDTDTGRFVLSGRMADVCAELERMAAQEPDARASEGAC